MIGSHEFRVGNLYNQFGFIHEVSGNIIEELSKAPESQLWFKRIEITEDWLLKFGFENKGNLWGLYPLFVLGNISVKIMDDGCKIRLFKTELPLKYKYIDQIQNINFYLTGKDLISNE